MYIFVRKDTQRRTLDCKTVQRSNNAASGDQSIWSRATAVPDSSLPRNASINSMSGPARKDFWYSRARVLPYNVSHEWNHSVVGCSSSEAPCSDSAPVSARSPSDSSAACSAASLSWGTTSSSHEALGTTGSSSGIYW
jgi:hypothetical protein